MMNAMPMTGRIFLRRPVLGSLGPPFLTLLFQLQPWLVAQCLGSILAGLADVSATGLEHVFKCWILS